METSFKGYITDFEIDFLIAYLPPAQIEKGNVTEEEKKAILKYVGNPD